MDFLKKKMKISFLYFSLLILSIDVVPLACICVCPSNSTTILPCAKPQDLSLSPQDEIIDGVNYGKLISLNNLIYMSKDVEISRSLSPLGHDCPNGYENILFKNFNLLF